MHLSNWRIELLSKKKVCHKVCELWGLVTFIWEFSGTISKILRNMNQWRGNGYTLPQVGLRLYNVHLKDWKISWGPIYPSSFSLRKFLGLMKSLHWVILIIYSVLFLEILLELTSLKTLRGRFECWIKCQMGCQIECCIGCWIGFWIGVSEWVLIEGLCKRCLPIQNGAALCIWPMAGAAILPDEMRVLAFSQIWPFLVSESFSLGSWVL